MLQRLIDVVTGRLHRRSESTQLLERLIHDVEFIKRRLSTYVGDGVALTFLADESPIFVNSNDFGGPANLVAGGRYEPDNTIVLLSYLRPDSVVVDVGANLGFFTLQLARRLRSGHVHAFEPHPSLGELLGRTVHVNGVRDRVTIHSFCLSDRDGPIKMYFPQGHLGGGRIVPGKTSESAQHRQEAFMDSERKTLDGVLPAGTAVDLVKIDVEGHELSVLRGMRRVIDDSPHMVLLLEKLMSRPGYEERLLEFFGARRFDLYGVTSGAFLKPLDLESLRTWRGYVLATRRDDVESLDRNIMSIYPQQLFMPGYNFGGETPTPLAAKKGEVLFYGPYWLMDRGMWSLTIDGDLRGEVGITVAGLQGRQVGTMYFNDGALTQSFELDYDLPQAEFVARATGPMTNLHLRRLVVRRLNHQCDKPSPTSA
jgi:FkbM family methyltransferase